jgi:CDP-diacylglycerol---glycerol-3-phosphate 3-phosphatidyltransferase
LIRESKLGQWYLIWVEEVPVPILARMAFKPNHLTCLGFLFAFLTIPAYRYALWLGGLGGLISGFVDTLDGSLARKMERKTRSGAFLDSVFDRYSDFFMVFGLWLYFQKHPHPWMSFITPTLFFYLSGSFLVSYSRARGESLGLSSSIGFFSRGERVLVLGVGSIVNDLIMRFLPVPIGMPPDWPLLFILILLTLGTHLTALQRIIHLTRNL